jgi:cytochrome c oxidase assembly protein subunit 15
MSVLALDEPNIAETAETRGLRAWLLLLVLLVFAMVIVGGATRLTESGLSITEWDLVTGSLPPLGADAWQHAFALYKESPQYALLNKGMSLADFKTIYWWEWAHRELGRFIGFFYIAGFLWFVGRRSVSLRKALLLAGLGVLLGAQGVAGWVMVASGLKPGMIAVAPLKLTLHLVLATILYASLITAFVRFGGAEREPAPAPFRWMARVIVALAFVQIALGALVAGHNAGLIYNTWPLMGGRVLPGDLTAMEPLWANFLDNLTTIQFNHRLGAYLIFAVVVAYAIVMRRASSAARNRALLMVAIVLLQVSIGVATLLHAVPIALALAHQAVAMILLLIFVWNAAVFARDDAA